MSPARKARTEVGSKHQTSPAVRARTVVHPLGPLFYRIEPRRPIPARIVASLVFFGCVGFLGLAAWLIPDPSGVGSHQQLGFPPCTMMVLTGYPCPTCGMTTAFAHTVRGELGSAFHAQPAGLVLALGTIFAAGISLGVLITGKVWAVNWYRVSPARVTLVMMLLLAFGWAYKVVTGVLDGTLPVGR